MKTNSWDLQEELAKVLKQNHRGTHTTPAAHLYPHQWLWDSAFIAIGLRHIDTSVAMQEIDSIFRGQWTNGMLPHMVFSDAPAYERDRKMWSSHLSPYSPADYSTSGITQPPMIAEAMIQVGHKLHAQDRRDWYKYLLPKLIDYHQWLFRERDPHQSGLTIQVHPYETGLDNTPPWIKQLHERRKPWWISALEKTSADRLINLVRRDTRHVPPGQRMSNVDALLYWDIIRSFRGKRWNMDSMMHKADFMIEDLSFNCIFARANQHLIEIAELARTKLPADLLSNIKQNQEAINEFWSEEDGMFYSRDFVTRKLIKEPTIASLMPLYSGAIDESKALRLVEKLTDHRHYKLKFPIPSVPLTSSYYKEEHYWQGPSWLNTNWLIIDGLRRYGFTTEADNIQKSSVDMVEHGGPYEYFSAKSGKGLGAKNFSWTAALCLDMLLEKPPKEHTEPKDKN